jgi:hypothetical protein
MYLNNTYYHMAIYASQKQEQHLLLEENKLKKRNRK